MRGWRLLMALGCFWPLVSAVHAQTSDSVDPAVLKNKNGYFWEYLKKANSQLAFVQGYLDGYRYGVNAYYEDMLEFNSDKVNRFNKHVVRRLAVLDDFTEGQFLQYVDEFYADQRNRLLPISVAFGYAHQVFSGRDRAEIDQWLNRRRKVIEKN